MFLKQIGSSVVEVSHKRIEKPRQSVYYNHIHNHCELLLFISGEADYNIDGRIFKPRPFDLLFIPAATYHYLIPTASVPYENYVVGIDPAEIPKSHYDLLFSPPYLVNIREDAELRGFFTRLDLFESIFSPEDFDRCAKALIAQLITYCAYRKEGLDFVHSRSLTPIEKTVLYVSEHLEEKLDAEVLAKHLLLSKSYLQNLFSQTMHIGLKKYIMQKKIYAAHADLQRGMTPGEVCEKYAFGEYSVFYRTYVQNFHCAPTSKKKSLS